jgi:hypothetical protein
MKTKNDRWIYTYDYAPGQVWDAWRTSEGIPEWLPKEITAVSARASLRISDTALSFALLADNHYTINGTWRDTGEALRRLSAEFKLSGVIHLGDMTDGMLPRAQTEALENTVKRDLKSFGVPIYIAPGNHDYNYFKGNPDLVYPETPRFFADCGDRGLRLIFIDSFDPRERPRYGFTEICVMWLASVLDSLPDGYAAIVFSHVPPLVRLQAWAADIRGRVALMDVLNRHADRILALICGHNHCDLLFNDLYNGKFPILSINCAKCEYFKEHKPEGAVVPYRALGERTQESFDIMTVDTGKREIYFTRFGAGDDRLVRNGKAEWAG